MLLLLIGGLLLESIGMGGMLGSPVDDAQTKFNVVSVASSVGESFAPASDMRTEPVLSWSEFPPPLPSPRWLGDGELKYNQWVDRSRHGLTSPIPPQPGARCKGAPVLSTDIRGLLRRRNFSEVLARTDGTVGGFVRIFAHARPWSRPDLFDWIIRRGELIKADWSVDPNRVQSDAVDISLEALKQRLAKIALCSADITCRGGHPPHGPVHCRRPGPTPRSAICTAAMADLPTNGSSTSLCPDNSSLLKAWTPCPAAGFRPLAPRALVVMQSDDHSSGWQVPRGGTHHTMCCRMKKRRKEWKRLGCFCQTEVKSHPAYIRSFHDSGFFASLAWEAMDDPAPGLRAVPIPFTVGYAAAVASERNIHSANLSSVTTTREHPLLAAADNAPRMMSRKQGIIAAWGTAWPLLDTMVESRIEAIAWLANTTLATRESIAPSQYHNELLRRRFALSPTGGGVQSPKVWESILAYTLPILQRRGAAAYACFREAGFPLIIVDKWEDVTTEAMERWWLEYSPQLERARWMMLTEVWWAYSTWPCPITNIGAFLDEISADV